MKPMPDARENRRLAKIEKQKAERLAAGAAKESHLKKARDHESSAFKRLAQFDTQSPQVRGYVRGYRVSGDDCPRDDCALASTGSPLLAVYAPLTGEASTRVGLMPFFQIGRRPIRPLLLLDRSLPRLVSLLGVFPVGLLARIVVWFFFAHGGTSQGQPKMPDAVPDA
jgi:hypothetical protein